MSWFILTISLILGSSLPHHPTVRESSGKVKFYLDKAIFSLSDSLYYSEIYYLLDLATLRAEEVEGKLQSSYKIHVSLLDREGKRKTIEDEWKSRAIRGGQTQFVIDKFDLILAPGKYTLKMRVEDLKSGNSGEATLDIDIPQINAGLELSDIELAWKIDTDTTTPFLKYGINVVPNPLANYSSDKDTLLFFYEIYGLSDSGKMVINYAIYDEEGNVVLASKPAIKQIKGKKDVEVGGLYLGNLKEGLYRLVVEVVDLGTGKRVRRERGFSFFEKKKFELTPEIDSILAFIDYFATQDEMKAFKETKGEGRRLFLLKFWKKRDPIPETEENEFLGEFVRRVKYADQNFSFAGRKGRYTDMGRIYIKYGPPDEIKRVTVAFGERDRIKWVYYNGGMTFIFVDLSGSGDYRLVYSNVPEEPGMPNWREIIPESELEGVDEGTW